MYRPVLAAGDCIFAAGHLYAPMLFIQQLEESWLTVWPVSTTLVHEWLLRGGNDEFGAGLWRRRSSGRPGGLAGFTDQWFYLYDHRAAV